jgi:glycosyltransferase involved in cell wall biosynthesis
LNLLFVYRTLTLGGVESVIFHRMDALEKVGIQSWAFFQHDYGGSGLADRWRERIFTGSPEDLIRVIMELRPAWVSIVDNPFLAKKVHSALPHTKQIYELHTTQPKDVNALRDPDLQAVIQGVLVPSMAQKELAESMTKGKIPVLLTPNGLPAAYWTDIPNLPTLKNPVVAWIGRLEVHKGWRQFLDITKHCAQIHTNVHFWLIGGQRATEQQQQVMWSVLSHNGLQQRFRWFPEVPGQAIPALMQTVTRSGGCLVSTSRSESFGLSALEAMASGCPVIVPPVGGLKELVIDNKTGLSYPTGNIKAASMAILKLLSNSAFQQQIGLQARQQTLQFQSQNAIVIFLKAVKILEMQATI